MDSKNIISIREFARRVGSSEGNIRKIIKAGKISKGLNSSGKIVYNVALSEYKEWYGYKMPEIKNEVKENKVIESKEVEETELETDPVEFVEDKPIRIRNSARFEEAKRLEQVIKTRTAQLEYEQLKGSLVSSKEVYKELFAVGQTVRSSLQGIPDKYIDNILACETRIEAHEMLNKAITDALEELSNAVKEVEI